MNLMEMGLILCWISSTCLIVLRFGRIVMAWNLTKKAVTNE